MEKEKIDRNVLFYKPHDNYEKPSYMADMSTRISFWETNDR